MSVWWLSRFVDERGDGLQMAQTDGLKFNILRIYWLQESTLEGFFFIENDQTILYQYINFTRDNYYHIL